MTHKQYKVYLLLLVLAIFSWTIADFFEEEGVIKVAVTDHSPDYFSLGYYKKEMNEQGLIKNELNASKVTHYSDDKTTHLENPVMTLYNSNKAPWVIKSEAGILKDEGDHLDLIGMVSINREATKYRSSFQINTTNLRITPSINYAVTDEWAELINDSQITEGVGLQATFVNPVHLKFLSKVKGRYEVN